MLLLYPSDSSTCYAADAYSTFFYLQKTSSDWLKNKFYTIFYTTMLRNPPNNLTMRWMNEANVFWSQHRVILSSKYLKIWWRRGKRTAESTVSKSGTNAVLHSLSCSWLLLETNICFALRIPPFSQLKNQTYLPSFYFLILPCIPSFPKTRERTTAPFLLKTEKKWISQV